MNQVDMKRKVSLTVPADMNYAPVVTLALSGLGMIAGLDVDLLGSSERSARRLSSAGAEDGRHRQGLDNCT